MYDVIIVGAGVTGCAVARYLSRCQGSFLVLEREEDVCCGTSKANSAIVHAGFDAAHGSLMAKFNLRGTLPVSPPRRHLALPAASSVSLPCPFWSLTRRAAHWPQHCRWPFS